jgi:ABC-2 type transport system ATP-binding protein
MLKVENVSKSFKNKKVLEDISFEINENEIFGLIGKNASGKSTIINIIGGILKKDKGKITFKGNEVFYPDIFSYISICPENPFFYNHLSLYDNYKFFSKIYGNKENYDVLEMLKLKDFLKNKFKEVSKGTKQKLALSIFLWRDASIYILDEPFENLDPETRNLIFERINELKNQNKGILITTHRKEDIFICDRIGILENGKIRFAGLKDDEEINKFFDENAHKI